MAWRRQCELIHSGLILREEQRGMEKERCPGQNQKMGKNLHLFARFFYDSHTLFGCDCSFNLTSLFSMTVSSLGELASISDILKNFMVPKFYRVMKEQGRMKF